MPPWIQSQPSPCARDCHLKPSLTIQTLTRGAPCLMSRCPTMHKSKSAASGPTASSPSRCSRTFSLHHSTSKLCSLCCSTTAITGGASSCYQTRRSKVSGNRGGSHKTSTPRSSSMFIGSRWGLRHRIAWVPQRRCTRPRRRLRSPSSIKCSS